MRKIHLVYSILIVCFLSVGGWYLWGWWQKDKEVSVDQTNVEAINKAMNLIEGQSVYSTGKDKLIEGAIRGMADAIEDPYSTYYSKEEAEQQRQSLAKERVGVGLEITESGGKFIVVSPVKTSPAERAGIRPLDEIVQVNEERLGGKTMSELMHLIQGEKGTSVTIVVYRPSVDKHIKVTMEREAISNKTVASEVVTIGDTSIGYVSISIFGEKTAEEWVAETTKLLRKDVEGIVIDVRDNPGGYLHSVAALISSLLDDQKVFAYMQNAEGAMEPLNTSEKGFEKNYIQSMRKMPLVLLQNGGSASASEVLSGALEGWGRASIIGTTSFGKGTVQKTWDLPNGGELKLSTNKWLTPKRNWIHGKGIEAELPVDQNELFAVELHPLTGQYKSGDIHEEIAYTQNVLKKLGYHVTRTDGYLDSSTEAAVLRYRKEKKLLKAVDTMIMDKEFFTSLNETLKTYKEDRANDLQFQMAVSFLMHKIEQ